MLKTGAGTPLCKACEKEKEPTRFGSNKCRACNNRGSSRREPTKAIRTNLPADVWDALQVEATDKGTTIGAHLRDLVVARHARKTG